MNLEMENNMTEREQSELALEILREIGEDIAEYKYTTVMVKVHETIQKFVKDREGEG